MRNLGGRWIATAGSGMEDLSRAPMMVELPGGSTCNPVGKVLKRYVNGEEDDLAFFYHVISRR